MPQNKIKYTLYHERRKEEEQRRQLEADFVQTFRRRHTLRHKLAEVERQIYDLERGYRFEVLEGCGFLAGSGSSRQGGKQEGGEGGPKEEALMFSRSSATSPLSVQPEHQHQPGQVSGPR